jgi:hypothetical protein
VTDDARPSCATGPAEVGTPRHREFQANVAEFLPGARQQLTPSSFFRPKDAGSSFPIT